MLLGSAACWWLFGFACCCCLALGFLVVVPFAEGLEHVGGEFFACLPAVDVVGFEIGGFGASLPVGHGGGALVAVAGEAGVAECCWYVFGVGGPAHGGLLWAWVEGHCFGAVALLLVCGLCDGVWLVLVHEAVVSAVDAVLEEGEDDESDAAGEDADGPECCGASDVLGSAFAFAAAYAALAGVGLDVHVVELCHVGNGIGGV